MGSSFRRIAVGAFVAGSCAAAIGLLDGSADEPETAVAVGLGHPGEDGHDHDHGPAPAPTAAPAPPRPVGPEAAASYRDAAAAERMVPFELGGVVVYVPRDAVAAPVAELPPQDGQPATLLRRSNAVFQAGERSFNVTVSEYADADTAHRHVEAMGSDPALAAPLAAERARGGARVLDLQIGGGGNWQSTATQVDRFVVEVNSNTVPVRVLHDIALATVLRQPTDTTADEQVG